MISEEIKDPLKRVQDFKTSCNNCRPSYEKQTPVNVTFEAPEFVPAVTLNLPSQTPADLPTHAKSPEVNVLPDLGTCNWQRTLLLSTSDIHTL